MAAVSGFVHRLGEGFVLEGKPYRIAGGNTYYLAYVHEPTLNAALDLAGGFGMNAIRIWAFLDAAQAPGAGEVCFQYWDPVSAAPRINDGPNGLERLDRAIANAGERGMRLILTLTNNWADFGGMPRYVQWFGFDVKFKNQFYLDQRCRQAYRHWVEQLITRRNTITGRLYRDEPAILAWELANEPRCENPGGLRTLLGWVDEMSAFVRELDANHLIAVGDEGYFNHQFAGRNALFNGQYGVGCEELLGLGAIDFGTMHMYPQSMAKGQDPVEFGRMWIREHIEAARRASKPMLVEEYGMMVGGPDGLQSEAERNRIFEQWLALIEEMNGAGDMLWMMGLAKSAEQPYDPDAYVVRNAADAPSIGAHSARMLRGA